METYSNYYIKSKNEPKKVVCFADSNPRGVNLLITDEAKEETISFNLPRMEMIEALEYVLAKIKARKTE